MLKSYNHLIILIIAALTICFSDYTPGQELIPVKLPAPQMEIGKPLMQALMLRQSTRNFDTKPLPMQELSNLLWAAYGINRIESGKRTAPSAMNWQEMDVYVFLETGTYCYDAKTNSLSPALAGDNRALCGVQDFVKTAPVNLVYIADLNKVARANEEDKALWTAADCGFIAQNVYLYCASQGLGVVVRAMIDRAKLAKALKLGDDHKILLSQTIGYAK